MKSWMLLLILTLTQVNAEPEVWPSVPFKYVIAYCYDYSQDPRGSSITFEDGSLHKGVIRATTVRLTEPQVQQVVGVLTKVAEADGGEADCYDPHHAFVFYDAEWKVIGSIDICFLCGNYQARPKGVSENINLVELEKFCRIIGLPVYEKKEAYSTLFKQEQASEEGKKAPEKAPKKLKDEEAIDPPKSGELLEGGILPPMEDLLIE